ncbi:hypothetical protein [Cellulomonas phragmiteti]|nr:hypothetical protein [Cellulomonas phragmiteti]
MTGPSGPFPDPGHPPHASAASSPTAPLPAGWSGAVGTPASYPPSFAGEPPATGSRHSRLTVVLAVVLVVVLVAGGLIGWRLWSTTREWQESAAGWEELARAHGEQLGQTLAELEATTGELDATRTQLATATARITELADEKAQLGDTTAAQQQLADYQERVSQAAGRVATALATCIDGQERLIGYLEEAARYEAADIARFRADVDRVCGAATDANAQLQDELAP